MDTWPNEEVDLALALQLQAKFKEELRVANESRVGSLKGGKAIEFKKERHLEPEQEKLSVSLVDPTWELLDPNPDILNLFLIFNDQFFWSRLSSIEVKWSPRMTLCAGVCSYERRGGLCSVRLSIPLLKLRPRKDLIETLLHEMIHAYLFVTDNNTDHDGHGPQFHEHMYRINKLAGTNISVYHSFHDEVNIYRQHIWRCNGPCQKRPPYYGLVKRSMNRAPSHRDVWWSQHQATCGGTYAKIKEPAGYGAKNKKPKELDVPQSDSKLDDIRKYFSSDSKKLRTDFSSVPSKENADPQKNNSSRWSQSDGGNMKRLGSTAEDADGQSFNIENRSNVHWFNKGSGASKTKPSNEPKRGRPNKSAGTSSKTKDFKGGRGTGTRMKSGATGSSTMVIKGKKTTSHTEGTGHHNAQTSFIPFTGSGQTLGIQPGSGGSSLVSSSEPEIPQNSEIRNPSTYSATAASSSSRDTSPVPETCPLCSKRLSSGDYDEHIAECLGEFENTEDFDVMCRDVDATISKSDSSENAVSSRDIHDTDSSAHASFHDTINNELSDDNVNNTSTLDIGSSNTGANPSIYDGDIECIDIRYPCPVCNHSFFESVLNRHVNEHFS